MKKNSLTLAMIVGKPDHKLQRCLDNMEPYVDEIVLGVNPEYLDVLEGNEKIKIYPQPKACIKKLSNKEQDFIKGFGVTPTESIFLFDVARNDIFSKAKGDWIMWLDDDDIVDHPELIKPTIEAARDEIKAIQVNYAYTLDAYGRSIADHWRTRLIRRDSDFVWRGHIHEDLLSDSRGEMAQTYEWEVKHLQEENNGLGRNIVSLLSELYDKEKPDPRILYYVGTTLFDLGQAETGVEILRQYIKVSGWDEQIYDAMVWIGKKAGSVKDFMEAMALIPNYPMAYLGLADLYREQKEHKKAIEWYQIGLKKPKPKTALFINPRSLDVVPLMHLSECLYALGRISEALTGIEQALKFYPEDKDLLKLHTEYLDANNKVEVQKAIRKLALYLKDTDQEKYIPQVIPADVEETQAMSIIRNKIVGAKQWDKDTITIYCPHSWENWGPESLETGIGGSEEAVIRLSRELRDLGWKVTVYATPFTRGVVDGVRWLNAHEINLADEFNVFVCWRTPSVFTHKIKGKKYLWLHDVHEKAEFTPEVLSNLDKVIVLSKYHRSLFPNIPEEKIMYSANGLTIDYKKYKNTPRNPYKLIYTSCPSRGLEHLLDWWPEIKKAQPKAELHVFYGFDNYIKGWKQNPERMAWVDEMKQKLKQDGITFYGRTGQDEINRHTAESGVWAYPTEFPEISCITAMKMQALGAVPVTTGFAALEETQHFGFANNNLEIVKNHIIYLLEETEDEDIRQQMMDWARKEFQWAKIAKEWTNEFTRKA